VQGNGSYAVLSLTRYQCRIHRENGRVPTCKQVEMGGR